jgi:hypothetical protein
LHDWKEGAAARAGLAVEVPRIVVTASGSSQSGGGKPVIPSEVRNLHVLIFKKTNADASLRSA